MRVLIVQFRPDPAKAHLQEQLFRRAAGARAELLFVNVFHGSLNTYRKLGGIDAVVLGGSHLVPQDDFPGREALIAITKRVFNQRIPCLGVCFGFQWLMHTVEVEVVRMRAEEEGLRMLYLTSAGQASSLFAGCPNKFAVMQSHWWEVPGLPKGAVLLARGNKVRSQAVQFADAPIYGVQFHPERTPADVDRLAAAGILSPRAARTTLARTRQDFCAPLVLTNFLEIAEGKA